jgi:tetratricopeptide (TPR) repeat protein
MEQSDVSTPKSSRGPIVSFGRALSSEVRASLEAVRVAREAAQHRARKQTLRARLWFAVGLAAVGVAVLAFGPSMARWRHPRAKVAAPAPVTAPVAEPRAAEATAPVPPVQAPAPAPAERTVPPFAPKAASGSAAAANTGDGCDAALVRRTPWLLSPQACAAVFDANPTDATLALGIAQAEHARGRFDESAQWARRALALDPRAAESYVLIARTEAKAGRQEEALDAYRKYLELAPRGWHRAEAQTALRRAAARAPAHRP